MISGIAVAVTPYVVGTLLGAGGVIIVENQVSLVTLIDLLVDLQGVLCLIELCCAGENQRNYGLLGSPLSVINER